MAATKWARSCLGSRPYLDSSLPTASTRNFQNSGQNLRNYRPLFSPFFNGNIGRRTLREEEIRIGLTARNLATRMLNIALPLSAPPLNFLENGRQEKTRWQQHNNLSDGHLGQQDAATGQTPMPLKS